jgi:hypothetical protein
MGDLLKQIAIAVAPKVADVVLDVARERLRERDEEPARPGTFAAYVQLRRVRG